MYRPPSHDFQPPQLPFLYPMIRDKSREEASRILQPYCDAYEGDNLAFFCLSLQEPQAYGMFWLTHKTDYDYSNYDMISAIFDKKYQHVASSCQEYYQKAQEFLGQLIENNIMPQDQIDCLKSEEGKKYVQYLVGRESNREYDNGMLKEGLHKAATPGIIALLRQRDENHGFYPQLLIAIEKAILYRDSPKASCVPTLSSTSKNFKI